MTIGATDRVLFQMSINGKEVPFDQNTLDFFHLVESVRLHVPAMSVQIQDTVRFFTQQDLLVDGATIQVTLGIENKKIVFPMRYFTHKEVPTSGNPTFLIYAYLDVPLYWTSSLVRTIRGTASSVLQDLCTYSGLTYDGINTNDSQLWIPYNRKIKEFAKYVVSRAYVDDSSCTQMSVNINKQMRVRNVSDFDKFPVIQTFANQPGTGQSTISDHRVVNKSGFFNAVSGYKDAHIAQSNLAPDETYKDAKVKKNSSKLMMNETVRGAIGQNRISHAPIDVGNVNQSYTKALYQNQRMGNLFSSGLELITPNLCNAEIMDVVGAQIHRPEAGNITVLSGKYMLTSRVWYLSNNNFAQKLEMFRHGLNDKREATQA